MVRKVNYPLLRNDRGFLEYGIFSTQWHKEIRVAESSAAGRTACVFVTAEHSYSNEPTQNPPWLHLTYADAVKLRDSLNLFINSADEGQTVEPPRYDGE